MKKIFIRSPYFIEIDEEAQTTGKVELYIWNKESTKPSVPTYTLTKTVPSTNQNKLDWNLSNYAKEFIKPVAPVVVESPVEESDKTWCYMQIISYSDEWCDGHKNWNNVSSRTKRAMGLHHQFDGEFWMEFFADFCKEFEEVSHLFADFCKEFEEVSGLLADFCSKI